MKTEYTVEDMIGDFINLTRGQVKGRSPSVTHRFRIGVFDKETESSYYSSAYLPIGDIGSGVVNIMALKKDTGVDIGLYQGSSCPDRIFGMISSVVIKQMDNEPVGTRYIIEVGDNKSAEARDQED